MKLVKFKNGKYGVRKGSFLFGYEFLDVNYENRWWLEAKNIEKYAQTTYEAANKLFLKANNPRILDTGKVIKRGRE